MQKVWKYRLKDGGSIPLASKLFVINNLQRRMITDVITCFIVYRYYPQGFTQIYLNLFTGDKSLTK
jgi:hypothetical protein